MADSHGRHQPERDLDQHAHQGEPDDQAHDAVHVGPEESPSSRGEENPQGGDQHQRLDHLNRQTRGEGAPPPASDRVQTRQRMTHQSQWCRYDQDDGDRDAHDVGDEQYHQHHDKRSSQQNQEDSVPGDRPGQFLQRGGGRVGLDPATGECLGQRVREHDRLGRQQHAHGTGNEPDHDPWQQFLQ
ncbi:MULTISPECIES: hypothetical protein [Nocardia]|uniref:hypothetical protein n=1 Tax=Nocardia TaxID=1817 RepID=UPI002458042F|nr:MULTISPECIES: hypothetical protein [Nocardia]